MVSFENFVKSVPPSLSELKVKPSFCFPIKIRDDRAVTNKYIPLHIFAPGVSAVASCRKVLGMPVVLLISFCLNLPLRRVQINIINFVR